MPYKCIYCKRIQEDVIEKRGGQTVVKRCEYCGGVIWLKIPVGRIRRVKAE
ncbi:MAG: DNA-directed RNA polymerase subunit P [Archaeoglobi archaeon]|nr:DNA-directed RNA polymerase subunit P [Candidatus Mnemosynella sp.]